MFLTTDNEFNKICSEINDAKRSPEDAKKEKEKARVKALLFSEMFCSELGESKRLERYLEKLKKAYETNLCIYDDIKDEDSHIGRIAKKDGLQYTRDAILRFPLYFAALDPKLNLMDADDGDPIQECISAASAGITFQPFTEFTSEELGSAGPGVTYNDLFDNLIKNNNHIFRDAAYTYFRVVSLMRKDIDKENAVTLAMPQTIGEFEAFRYIYSVIATGYAKLAWTRCAVMNKYKKATKFAHKAENEKKRADRLQAALDTVTKSMDESDASIREAEKHLAELEKEMEVLRANDPTALQERIEELERQLAKSRANEARITEKYNTLKAQMEEDEDQDEEESAVQVPRLTAESRLDIFAEPAATGKLDQRFNDIVAMFPNSRLVTDPNALDPRCDAVVLLTKFIGHPQYYSAKRVCEVRGIPYIHIGVKSPEAVRDQILNPVAYQT